MLVLSLYQLWCSNKNRLFHIKSLSVRKIIKAQYTPKTEGNAKVAMTSHTRAAITFLYNVKDVVCYIYVSVNAATNFTVVHWHCTVNKAPQLKSSGVIKSFKSFISLISKVTSINNDSIVSHCQFLCAAHSGIYISLKPFW